MNTNPAPNTVTNAAPNTPQPLERPNLTPFESSQSWYRKPSVFYVIIAAGLVAWLIIRSSFTAPNPPPKATSDPPPTDATSQATGFYDPKPEAVAFESLRKAKVAAAKVSQRRTLDIGDEVLTAANEGHFEATQWDSEFASILDGDTGRRIATKPELVKAFRAVTEVDRPSKAEFEQFKVLATTALEPVNKASANPENTWDNLSDTSKVLIALRADARSRRDAARAARSRMQSVVSLAKRDHVGELPPGSKSLQEAIRGLEQQEAEELAVAVQAAREKAREEVKMLLATTAAENVRLAGQAEAKREAAKAEAVRTKIELEAEAVRIKVAKDRLRAKLESPEVLLDLAIFTAKGYTQPGQGGTGVFEKTDVFGPVSFTRLKTGGYLDPTADGLKKLLRLGAEPSMSNDRPKWKFNAFRLDQSNEAYLKRVQGLLVELGSVMVEDNLLAR
jgi:hypothetical protein